MGVQQILLMSLRKELFVFFLQLLLQEPTWGLPILQDIYRVGGRVWTPDSCPKSFWPFLGGF